MRTRLVALCAALCLTLPYPAAAEPAVQATGAWVRETLPGQSVTAAYLVLTLSGASPDALVGATCDCAKTVEIHRMVQVGETMRMEPIDRLPLAPGERVALEPGGLHLMLFGAEHRAPGERVRLILRFEKAEPIEVDAVVRRPEGAAGGAH